MLKIKNGGLDQYGKLQSLYGIGSERVNLLESQCSSASPTVHRQRWFRLFLFFFSSPKLSVLNGTLNPVSLIVFSAELNAECNSLL